MIINVTNRVLTAGADARIFALVLDTRQLGWAIVIIDALWSTSDVRISLILRYAGTYAIVALSVGTAWRWNTRVVRYRHRNYNIKSYT